MMQSTTTELGAPRRGGRSAFPGRSCRPVPLLLCALSLTAHASAPADPPRQPAETGQRRSVGFSSFILHPSSLARTNQQGADFRPPADPKQWEARRAEVRRRILVSTGLYPLWEKTPLKPQVYGRLERDGYTVEKVVLETLPGFYLSGNLYRPAKTEGKVPGILNPHGHWAEGRVNADVQARCAGQARMGAVAFQYDMVGYVDSAAFGHAFFDDELLGLGLNLPGLQLWNSIRALDWLLSLPEVDAERIACTGESGGGTQTFLLAAVDDRVKVAAPVCMVSHHFQGGCSCENSAGLRVGTDNVEFAALFAPKPLLLVGATGDWTSQILQRGVPEIRAAYRLQKAEDRLEAVVHRADHNYNQASRESVYAFFAKHLFKKPGAVREKAFQPEEPADLFTWDDAHPRPLRAASAAGVKSSLRTQLETRTQGWRPQDRDQWKADRELLAGALETLLGVGADPRWRAFRIHPKDTVSGPGYTGERFELSRTGMEPVTVCSIQAAGKRIPDAAVVVAHPAGMRGLTGPEGAPGELLDSLLRKNVAVVVPETPRAGAVEEIAKRQAGEYFAAYNRTVLAERVQAVLDAAAHSGLRFKRVALLGLEGGGTWALLARPFAEKVTRVAADTTAGDWPAALPITDERALPGARGYGGLKVFAALGKAEPLWLYGAEGALDPSWVRAAYQVENAEGRLRITPGTAPASELAAWLSR